MVIWLCHCTIHFIVYYNLYIFVNLLSTAGRRGVDTGGGSWVLGAELVAAFDVMVAVGALFLWFIHWGVAGLGILGIPDMSLRLSRSGSSPGGMPMFNSGSPVLQWGFKKL